jgi:prevent-host-death family protein
MDRNKPLNVHEAKAQFSELLDRAHAGQEIVVSKKGKPWAKIVPLREQTKRELGFGLGMGTVGESFFEPLPESELRAWESEAIEPVAAMRPSLRRKKATSVSKRGSRA